MTLERHAVAVTRLGREQIGTNRNAEFIQAERPRAVHVKQGEGGGRVATRRQT